MIIVLIYFMKVALLSYFQTVFYNFIINFKYCTTF